MPAADYQAPILTGRRLPRRKVASMQREKIAIAAAQVLDERGYADATVADVIARARVSRGAFYALFSDRDDCMTAILDLAAERLRAELARKAPAGLAPGERTTRAVGAALRLVDAERVLACAVLVEALRSGPLLATRRAEHLRRLAAALHAAAHPREDRRGAACIRCEALLGGVLAIVHARLLEDASEPLAELAPQLSALLLMAHAREPERGRARPRALGATRRAAARVGAAA